MIYSFYHFEHFNLIIYINKFKNSKTLIISLKSKNILPKIIHIK